MTKTTTIVFSGLNISRTLWQLSGQFALQNVLLNKRKCQLTIYSTDFDKVVAFLKERCYNILEVRCTGWHGFVLFVRKHLLLPLFFALLCVALAVCSNVCLKVEVEGDFPSQQVQQAMQQSGFGVGSSLWKFSADALENQLCAQLDAMYAVVTRRGSVLYVNVVQKKSAQPPVDMSARRDIVATVSGKVVRLLCQQGTAAVAVGDVVAKGDVLIYGLRTFNDGTTRQVYALGTVTVQQSSSGFAEFCGTTTQMVDTGNVFVANSVVLFGKSYGKLPPFESYRTQQQTTNLFPLNICVVRTVYYQTAQQTRTATLEECLPQLKQQALQQALQQAQFPVQFTQYTVSGNVVCATVYGQTEIT